MYETTDQINELAHAVSSLGVTPYVLQGQREADVLRTVRKEKDIRHWIFSGGNTVVTDEGAPQVPLELFLRNDKTLLLICYSMERALVQLGFPITVQYKFPPPRFACLFPRNSGVRAPGRRKFYDGFTVKFKFRVAKFEPSEHPFAAQTDVVKNQLSPHQR